jgi:hypothetical protein
MIIKIKEEVTQSLVKKTQSIKSQYPLFNPNLFNSKQIKQYNSNI